MSKIAIVAALEREVSPLIKNWRPVRREYQGRSFTFFERGDVVAVCGGIGVEAARRAAEAVIALYSPLLLQSVGFAGALDTTLRLGDTFSPSLLLDARDGSRIQLSGGDGTLITFNAVAGAAQKAKLAEAYQARAVDMEAAAVAASASSHGIAFAVTKVISDELNFEMPGVSAFIDGQGRFRTMNFTFFALLRPWLWRRLAILARNSSVAARALSASLQSFCADPGIVIPSPSTTALPTGSPQ